MVKAAHAINAPDNAGLRALFVQGELNACQLATVVDQLPQAMAALPDACRDEVIGYYLDAVKGSCGRRELRILTRRIVHRLGGDQGTRDEGKAQRAERVTWHDLGASPAATMRSMQRGTGGLVELIAVLSPAHAAQVTDAITALAAPQPSADPVTGERTRDSRPPAKRRADALLELVGAAARAGDAEAMRSTAKVAGGETSQDNGTLLCSRHHHVVHSRGYLATVTATGVRWDLTPGRMHHLPPTQNAA